MQEVFGLKVPRSLADICNPRAMALLVYDMQVGIVKQVKDGPAIVAAVRKALELARSYGVRVSFTRHMSLPRELMGAFQYRMAMAWQKVERPEEVRPWFLRDSPGFELAPELTPLSSEAIFDKITMSAFEGTPLAIALRDCSIRALAVVGLAMEVGIEPTVRHAADLGVIPIVVEDACGGGHPEAAARSVASLKFSGDAIFTDLATLQRLLERSTSFERDGAV